MKSFLLSLLLICSIISSASPQTSSVFPGIRLQGSLTDATGNLLNNQVNITIRLYKSVSGGIPVYTEYFENVDIKNGIMDVLLNTTSVPFDTLYWAETQVNSEVFSPRIQLAGVPYAYRAVKADTALIALTANPNGVAGGDLTGTYPNPNIKDGVVTSDKILNGTIQRNDVTATFKSPFSDTSDYAKASPPVGQAGGDLTGNYPNPLINNGTVTAAKIATNQVVKSLNGLRDQVKLSAQGGATITSSNDTIYINAGAGGTGTGIQGIQNTNNTLDILNPNGPTATVNVKNGSIGTTQLTDSSVTSVKIKDMTIQFNDIAQNGATTNQVMKWKDTAWVASNDESGSGTFLPLAGGVMTGAITNTGNPSITMGKGNFGTGNINTGVDAFVAGRNNRARGDYSVVAGGGNDFFVQDSNSASGAWSVVSGGKSNSSRGEQSVVGGGAYNFSVDDYSTVSGGGYNLALSLGSAIGGGYQNQAHGAFSFIGGGQSNYTYGWGATVVAGNENRTLGYNSLIVGGQMNLTSGDLATICGGQWNRVRGNYSVLCGGGGDDITDSNSVLGPISFIGGGRGNLANDSGAVVVGGFKNTASSYSFIGGGRNNQGTGNSEVIGGGENNRCEGAYNFIGGGNGNHNYAGYNVIGGGMNNQSIFSYNVIGGGINNTAYMNSTISGGSNNEAGAYNGGGWWEYATVGGGTNNHALGEMCTVSGGSTNSADGYKATVGGGSNNFAGIYQRWRFISDNATIGGGLSNQALTSYSTIAGGNGNIAGVITGGEMDANGTIAPTIGGGANNSALGNYSAVPGGHLNTASGGYSFAAGRRAKAIHNGSFVWGDSTDLDFQSERDNQFRVRANGGTRFDVNNSRWVNNYDDGTNLINTSTGARLTIGGTWTNSSDRNLKENFTYVDGKDVLEKIAKIPISKWNYKSDSSNVKHIGPVAQDFYEQFGLGNDDKSISTVDPDGIALVAIQQLKKENDELRGKIEELRNLIKSLAEDRDDGNGKLIGGTK